MTSPDSRISAAELIRLMTDHRLRVFTTTDMLNLTKMTPSAATVALQRLALKNILVRIKRGVWVNRLITDLNPLEAAPYLSAPWPAYISFYSALAEYGKVEEIPHIIYAVSPAATRQYKTGIGNFQFCRLPANLMWGYAIKQSGRGGYPIAEPEKALLDLAYLALSRRSAVRFPYKRDGKWDLDMDKLKSYARRFDCRPLVDSLKKNNLWK
ncbi:MAG: hypothetical protein HY401_08030 [Elusimicrobia bacterium]|nr:hypothetical protein [Elusimicrobiota bacterium]